MRQVIVTTAHRDVWAGETNEDAEDGTIVLTQARHVFSWDAETGGLGGLAARGPGPKSRLSEPVTRARIRDVVTVLDCTPEATERIRSAGWHRG